MQTTVFTKVLIAALCGLGFLQIVQFVKNQTVTHSPASEMAQKNAPRATAEINTTAEDADPNFIIPENAVLYLKDRFALNQQEAEWVKTRYGLEAIFKQNGRTYEVEFDHLGKWLETELEDVPAIEIPTNVIEAAKKLYPTARISEYEIEMTPKGTFYEVEMTTDNGEVELYFDGKGNRTKNENEDK
jgi:uncharacterized membrane protein YkoI